MVEFYAVLMNMELIAAALYMFLVFFHGDKTWNKVLQLVLTSLLVLVNLVQTSMQIHMGEAYAMNMVLAALWFVNLLLVPFELKKRF